MILPSHFEIFEIPQRGAAGGQARSAPLAQEDAAEAERKKLEACSDAYEADLAAAGPILR